MVHLKLSLLGPFQAKLNNVPVDGFRSNKARGLLVYLAVEGNRSHSRSYLAGLLWPNWPEPTARTYLRQALANLRQILGDRNSISPFLLSTRVSIRFNPESDFWLDTMELERALATAKSPFSETDSSAILTTLERGIESYRGEFLSGFSFDDCPTFEEWQMQIAQRMQREVVDALGLLTNCYEKRNQLTRALHFAQRRVDMAPWLEDGQRHLMKLLVQSGEKVEALAAYERFHQRIEEQLATLPAPETTQLYEAIKASRYSDLKSLSYPGNQVKAEGTPVVGRSPVNSRESMPQSTRYPFVAREEELSKLQAHLAAALSEQGRVIWISGDAGSGKSALLDEFMRLAQRQYPNLLVANGKCSAYTGMGDPYLPFREILGMLTGDVERLSGCRQKRLLSALPSTVEALVYHTTDLIGSFLHGQSLIERLKQSIPAHHDLLEQITELVQRARMEESKRPSLRQTDLFAQATELLYRIARRHPLILFIDDLQWADLGSIGLLFHLAQHLDRIPLLIVGAYRPEEIRSNHYQEQHPLVPLVYEFGRRWGDIIVDLNAADGEHFVDTLLGKMPNHLSADFRRKLFERSQGHALFTTEMLDGLQRRGHLVQDNAGYWIEADSLDWAAMPARIDATIAERVTRLPDQLRRILTVASVEGELFTAEIVAHLLNADVHQIVQMLSGELDRQYNLIQAEGFRRIGEQRLSQYRFRHILFQEFLYVRLDDVERTFWHEAIAKWLEVYYQEALDSNVSHAAQLAWHFEKAGNADKAIFYFSHAGSRSVDIFANEEAIAHFQAALSLLRRMPQRADWMEQEFDIHEQLLIAIGVVYGHAAPILEPYLLRSEELAIVVNDAERSFRATWLLWQFYHVQGQLQAAKDQAQRLLGQAEQERENRQLVAAYYASGTTNFALGNLRNACTDLERTFAQLTEEEEVAYIHSYGIHPGVLSTIYMSLLHCIMGYPDRAVQMISQALLSAREAQHPFTYSFALVGAMGVYLLRREPTPTLRYAEESIAFCQEHGILQWPHWARHARGWSLVMLGNHSEGMKEAERGFEKWRGTGANLWGVRARAMLADACVHAGKLDRAQRLIIDAFEHLDQSGEALYQAELHRLESTLLNRQSTGNQHWEEIEAHLLQAISVAQQQEAKLLELRATIDLSRLYVKQSRTDRAKQLLTLMYNWFSTETDFPDLVEARTLLAQIGR